MSISFDASKPRDVAAFGRATVDLYANEIGLLEEAKTFSKYVGGSPANTAVAMARLGMVTGYIGKVSSDPFGIFVKNYLSQNGVDVSHIATAEPGVRTGVTIGEIMPDKCNYYVYRNDCADLHIKPEEMDEAYIAAHKMLLISGTSLSHSPAREAVFTAIAMAKRNGTRVAFDLDYRDYTWNNRQEAAVYLTMAAEKADIVLGTRDEFDVMEALLHPSNRNDAQSAAWLLEKGVSLVSIKKGRLGSLIYSHQGVTAGGIYPAKVLKTFGAGDSYSSAFNWGLIHGKTLEESLRYAAAASAITITGHSCSDAMPTLKQVEEYIASHEYVLSEELK